MAKSDKKADKKTADKAKAAKTAAASPAKAKSLASSKEILAKAVCIPVVQPSPSDLFTQPP